MEDKIYFENEFGTKNMKRIVLDKGECFGFEYYIITFGSYPCSYIKIPKEHKLYKKHYRYIDLDVHGGLTYSADHILGVDETGLNWYIGWDYAHAFDYQLFGKVDGELMEFKGHKYTLKELKLDVFEACKELKDIK